MNSFSLLGVHLVESFQVCQLMLTREYLRLLVVLQSLHVHRVPLLCCEIVIFRTIKWLTYEFWHGGWFLRTGQRIEEVPSYCLRMALVATVFDVFYFDWDFVLLLLHHLFDVHVIWGGIVRRFGCVGVWDLLNLFTDIRNFMVCTRSICGDSLWDFIGLQVRNPPPLEICHRLTVPIFRPNTLWT